MRQLLLIGALCLTACTVKEGATNTVNVLGMLFGAMPPPEQTTVLQELTREYDRCKAAGGGDECAQEAYAMVRKVKGMPEKPLPEGVVIIREDKDDPTVTVKKQE